MGYSNPEVDALLDAGIAELDAEARKGIYVDVLTRIIEDSAFLVLYQPVDQKAARASVQGVATHSVYMFNLRNASKSA